MNMTTILSALIATLETGPTRDIWSTADAAYYETTIKNVRYPNGTNGADLTEVISAARGRPRNIATLHVVAQEIGRPFGHEGMDVTLGIEAQRRSTGHIGTRAAAAGV
jgi:hypothetical protein